MAATGFATTRWSPGTMPTPTRTLHEARKSLEVGQHLSKILAPDQLLVRLHCAHTRWWPVIASPSQFSHRNPKACRWRPAVRFRWLIWSKKVCDVPEMAQGVSPLRVLNAVRLLVFCWRACPDMPKYHHVQGRHEKLWMWSVFNHNAQHWLKINCSRTLYWGKKTCSYRILWNQSIGDVNYHIICLSAPRLPLLFHQTSPCWGTTSFLWSWTRQAVMIIMQLLDSVDASGNKDLVKVRKYPLIRWGCHD